ncbi:MAG TPA: hypothetical protein VHK26_12060 [Methyloceanibacter sp.]|jgi:hypothetical protein|nr:hypothetical protein [Methyloceanibacter sp.]
MRRLALILLLLILGAGAWVIWSDRAARAALPEIAARLPSEEALNAMPLDQTVATLKAAVADCQRVARFKWNPLTRLCKGDALKSLSEHCELIDSRHEALQGP